MEKFVLLRGIFTDKEKFPDKPELKMASFNIRAIRNIVQKGDNTKIYFWKDAGFQTDFLADHPVQEVHQAIMNNSDIFK